MPQKLTERTELAEAPASGDWFHIVDVSDTTDSVQGTSKKVQSQYVTIADASTTVKGKVELATDAETITGADTVRAMTASNLTAKMDTDGTLAGNSDTRIPSQKSVKTYSDSGTQTMTNKTLTAPTISKPVMSATNPTAQTYTPSAAGTATLDLSLSNQHRITMPAGNITIALSNDTNSQIFTVAITQDGTGSRTVTWFPTIRWAGGSAPTLTTTASKRDNFGFIRTGSGTYDGFVVGFNV